MTTPTGRCCTAQLTVQQSGPAHVSCLGSLGAACRWSTDTNSWQPPASDRSGSAGFLCTTDCAGASTQLQYVQHCSDSGNVTVCDWQCMCCACNYSTTRSLVASVPVPLLQRCSKSCHLKSVITRRPLPLRVIQTCID